MPRFNQEQRQDSTRAEENNEEYIRFVYIFEEPNRREEIVYIGTKEHVQKHARIDPLNIELELDDAVTMGEQTFKIIGIERTPAFETLYHSFRGGMVTYYFSEKEAPFC